MRVVLASVMIAAAALSSAPAPAADLGGGAGTWAGAVHAGPYVSYDFEPGIVVRAYWLTPWAGRHYFPSGGKLPVVGRREEATPAPVSDKRSFHREWSSFPIDTIQQPPLILNQQQYFPGIAAPPAPAPSVSK
jgi:hypothetical protein